MKAEDKAPTTYQSISTSCKCGKNAELKWNGSWYGNKCECGISIRMHRDKSKMIVESVKPPSQTNI